MARSATILIAEDDFDDTFLLRRVFDRGQFGCSLQFVANGEEVLAYLQRQPPFSDEATHPIPDLILLDLHMPKKDGFEVLEWLRSSADFRRIPACVLSGHDYPPYKDRAIGLGAREFYPKRADVGEFTELVRGICDKWLQPRV